MITSEALKEVQLTATCDGPVLTFVSARPIWKVFREFCGS
jgi:hypothetical protein